MRQFCGVTDERIGDDGLHMPSWTPKRAIRQGTEIAAPTVTGASAGFR